MVSMMIANKFVPDQPYLRKRVSRRKEFSSYCASSANRIKEMSEGGWAVGHHEPDESALLDDTIPFYLENQAGAPALSPIVTRSKGKDAGTASSNNHEKANGTKSQNHPDVSENAASKSTQVLPKMLGRKLPKPKANKDECNNLTPPSKAPKKKRNSKRNQLAADEIGAASDATMPDTESNTSDYPTTVKRRPSPRSILAPNGSSRRQDVERYCYLRLVNRRLQAIIQFEETRSQPPRGQGSKNLLSSLIGKGDVDRNESLSVDGISDLSNDTQPNVPSVAGSSVSASRNTICQPSSNINEGFGVVFPYNMDSQVTIGVSKGVLTLQAGLPLSISTSEQTVKENIKIEGGQMNEVMENGNLARGEKTKELSRRKSRNQRRRRCSGNGSKKANENDPQNPRKFQGNLKNKTCSWLNKAGGTCQKTDSSEDPSEDSSSDSRSCSTFSTCSSNSSSDGSTFLSETSSESDFDSSNWDSSFVSSVYSSSGSKGCSTSSALTSHSSNDSSSLDSDSSSGTD